MPLFESQNYTLDGLDMNHSFGDNPNPTPVQSKGGGGIGMGAQQFTPIATNLPTGLDSPLATAAPTDATPLAVATVAPLPSSPVYAIAGPTAIAQKGTSTVKRSGLIILGILLGGALLFGQTTNTFYARSFAGRTVGEKVAAAQAACVSDTAVPCMIVIDATLNTAAQGTMPAPCQQCHIVDYRAGQPYSPLLDNGLTIKSVTVTRDGTYTACPTATTPASGDPAAVLAVTCVFHVGPNNYTLSGISVTSGGAYTTAPVIKITGAGIGGAIAIATMGLTPTPSTGLALTCDASTVTNYSQAICVFTVSSAQILAFDGTPGTAVTVISAPGSGRALSFMGSLMAEYLFNSAQYSGPLSMNLIAGTNAIMSAIGLPVDSNADAGTMFSIYEDFEGIPSDVVNAPLIFYSGAGFTPTGGDGTVKLTIRYTVVPLS